VVKLKPARQATSDTPRLRRAVSLLVQVHADMVFPAIGSMLALGFGMRIKGSHSRASGVV